MLANLSDMVSVIDARGNMTYVSPAALRMLGRNAADRVGASIFDYVHPDDIGNTMAQLELAKCTPGVLAPFQARVLHEDGGYRVFEVGVNNLLDDPAVNGIIVTSRDITERIEAENALRENERLYRTIVETADEGIWIVDANAETSFVNRRMASMLGTTAEVVMGRRALRLHGRRGPARLRASPRAPKARDQRAFRLQVRSRRRLVSSGPW